MAFPKWLKKIHDKFVAAENWMTQKRFLWVFVGAAIAMIGMTLFILSRRSETDYIRDDCGIVVWSPHDIPVPVWLEHSARDWEPDVLAGIRMMDPSGKLLLWKGIRPLSTEDPPKGAITVDVWNDEEHGNEHWEAIEDRERPGYCRMVRSLIRLPGPILPGKTRERAAAHELGHALGLGHSDWETDVMYRSATTRFPFSLTERDLKLLEDAYGKMP